MYLFTAYFTLTEPQQDNNLFTFHVSIKIFHTFTKTQNHFMKKLLVILSFLICAGVFKAQDQLFKKDNSKLLVKITEISPEEIKYKLYSNLNGPTYVVSKNEVSLVIFENGQHEVITSAEETAPASPRQQQPDAVRPRAGMGMSRPDSLKYYQYSESISMNFFNFLNMEVGMIYQKDFFRNNFNIMVPAAIGLERPSVTESVYFNGNNSTGINLDRKLFELGFGVNYYPSLRFPVNYYVGPMFRYMQYNCEQVYTYYTPNQYPYTYTPPTVIKKTGTLSRYCITITNGIIFRTKSRLLINMFGSVGFKNDVISNEIVDPRTNQTVKLLNTPFNLFFWGGFAVGFCF